MAMPPSNLHVEVPHVEGSPAGLAHQGIGLDQQPAQRLAALGPISQRQAPLAKLLVGQGHQFRLQGRIFCTTPAQRVSRQRFAPARSARSEFRSCREYCPRSLLHPEARSFTPRLHIIRRVCGTGGERGQGPGARGQGPGVRDCSSKLLSDGWQAACGFADVSERQILYARSTRVQGSGKDARGQRHWECLDFAPSTEYPSLALLCALPPEICNLQSSILPLSPVPWPLVPSSYKRPRES